MSNSPVRGGALSGVEAASSSRSRRSGQCASFGALRKTASPIWPWMRPFCVRMPPARLPDAAPLRLESTCDLHWLLPTCPARYQPRSGARAGVDVVRRLTGGRGVLHADEVTYSIVIAERAFAGAGVLEAYRILSEGLIAGLRRLGLRRIWPPASARIRGPREPTASPPLRPAIWS